MADKKAGAMKQKKQEDMLEKVAVSLLAAFGLFIIYQILRTLLGGSWASEDIIIALALFNLGLTIANLKKTETTAEKLSWLQRSFASLASDFKRLCGDFQQHMMEYHSRSA